MENCTKCRKKLPWKRTLQNIKSRCNNKKTPYYKNYGGRGIKCLITEEDIKFLYNRDKAYLMKQPSIDREENDGNYVLSNCRFIEKSKNSAKAHNKPVLQYDLNNQFVKEWSSCYIATKNLNISHSALTMCAQGLRKTSARFIWKYKK